MIQLPRWIVWLSRISHCRGFGIQSPTDYAFVRYVVNEHWPYYAYSEFTEADALKRKLGKLYFRLANWRQPQVMKPDSYQSYFQAGCHKTFFTTIINKVELARVTIEESDEFEQLIQRADSATVLVVEGIFRDWPRWHQIEQDVRVGTTFDLYYCGVVFFDTNRYKHHYKINF